MTTADIRANYSQVATAYLGKWAEALAVHGRALADRLPLAGDGLDGGDRSFGGGSSPVSGSGRPDQARRLVEVGCGPGLLLSHLRRVAPGTQVIGVDLTEAMLRQAPAEFGRVAADAQALPFRSGVLDAVLMPFVLFHLPDLPSALSEVRRTLVAGGSFGAVTWSGHDPHPAYEVWVRVIDEHGAPPDPSPQMPSNEITSDPEKLGIALQKAGFGAVDITVERFRHQPTAAEFLEHSRVIGAMARRIAELPADRRTACLAEAERELSKLDADAFIESGTVLYATATAT
ncbi:class I SAM-dependent methyltransferase [Kribbella sp. CA-293567]|uniref:class I SAM-dependent methyltransferase n=1 Tax=Kribbella sp. CA-293567 TaxID=3002436 RepID=UPI0022DDBEF1|nr:class I SAM-dependent methyltransferase [Kribbella sp. CA-293567]WBQ04895.1 methyltransferase domain-containing protein [Kribbella sp. CA-293567]